MVEKPSAREKYLSGKISAEDYARIVICNPVGDHALRESANKVKKIEEHLERQKVFA
jgi:hypothetical protein